MQLMTDTSQLYISVLLEGKEYNEILQKQS